MDISTPKSLRKMRPLLATAVALVVSGPQELRALTIRRSMQPRGPAGLERFRELVPEAIHQQPKAVGASGDHAPVLRDVPPHLDQDSLAWNGAQLMPQKVEPIDSEAAAAAVAMRPLTLPCWHAEKQLTAEFLAQDLADRRGYPRLQISIPPLLVEAGKSPDGKPQLKMNPEFKKFISDGSEKNQWPDPVARFRVRQRRDGEPSNFCDAWCSGHCRGGIGVYVAAQWLGGMFEELGQDFQECADVSKFGCGATVFVLGMHTACTWYRHCHVLQDPLFPGGSGLPVLFCPLGCPVTPRQLKRMAKLAGWRQKCKREEEPAEAAASQSETPTSLLRRRVSSQKTPSPQEKTSSPPRQPSPPASQNLHRREDLQWDEPDSD